MDYQSLVNEQLTFFPGDRNGSEWCTNITIQEDMLVECEEDFNITLSIVKEQQNLILGEATTTVSIVDSDGMIANYMTVPNNHTIIFYMQRLPSQCQTPPL